MARRKDDSEQQRRLGPAELGVQASDNYPQGLRAPVQTPCHGGAPGAAWSDGEPPTSHMQERLWLERARPASQTLVWGSRTKAVSAL